MFKTAAASSSVQQTIATPSYNTSLIKFKNLKQLTNVQFEQFIFLCKSTLLHALASQDEEKILSAIVNFKVLIHSLGYPILELNGMGLFINLLNKEASTGPVLNKAILTLSQDALLLLLKTLRYYIVAEFLVNTNRINEVGSNRVGSLITELKGQVIELSDSILLELNIIDSLNTLYLNANVHDLRALIKPLLLNKTVDFKLFEETVKQFKISIASFSLALPAEGLVTILAVHALSYYAHIDTKRLQFMLIALKKIQNNCTFTAYIAELILLLLASSQSQTITKLALQGQREHKGLLHLLHYKPTFLAKDNSHWPVRKLVFTGLSALQRHLVDEERIKLDKALELYQKEEKHLAIKSILAKRHEWLALAQQVFGITAELNYIFYEGVSSYKTLVSLMTLVNRVMSPSEVTIAVCQQLEALLTRRQDISSLFKAGIDNINDTNILFYFVTELLSVLAKVPPARESSVIEILCELYIYRHLVKADNTVDPAILNLLQSIIKLAWDQARMDLLATILHYYSKEINWPSLVKSLLKTSCLYVGNNRVWLFLLNHQLATLDILTPELFPVQLPEVINFLVANTGVNAEWLMELQHYQRFHLPEYWSAVKSIYQHDLFSEQTKRLLLFLVSRAWEVDEKAKNFILEIENLLIAYQQDALQQFLAAFYASQAMLSLSLLNETIKLILAIDKFETAQFSTQAEILEILADTTALDWSEKLRNLSARVYSLKYPEKDINVVMAEFRQQPYPISDDELENIQQCYQKIMAYFKQHQVYCLNNIQLTAKINQLTTTKINDEQFLIQYLALARQAIYLAKGYYPYNTQLFVVIAFLTHHQGKGRVAQVKTGQGKSIIVATIAGFYAIQGKHVDIVTTAENLAIRDAKEMRSFFALFNLKTMHNCLHPQYYDGCYAAEIVYGTPYNFECGYLYTYYDENEVRGKRRYDVILVDEVDSMFIDKASHSTRLICEKDIFARVTWIYPLLLKYKQENPAISTELAIQKLRKEPDYLASSYYLREHIDNNVVYWLQSAKKSLTLKKDVDYIVHNAEEINLVDYQYTGEIQQNTFYSRGLHQMLEVQNGIYPSVDKILSCQVSHLTFFNLYQKVFGLSGTLGSVEERNEIKHFYQLDNFDVPVHKQGKLIEKTFKLTGDDTSWLTAIANEAKDVAQQGRCVLILFEQIKDTYALYALFNRDNVQLLNGKQALSLDEVLALAGRPGTITIATNIAGRGSDIKPSNEAEHQGGMHVILGFYPLNQRVEAQAIGRTARQGRQGSYSFILQAQRENLTPTLTNLADIKRILHEKRETAEQQRVIARTTVYTPIALALDQAMQQFCQFRDKVRSQLKEHDLQALKSNWTWWFYINSNSAIDIEYNHNVSAVHDFTERFALNCATFLTSMRMHIKQEKLVQQPEILLARAKYYIDGKQYNLAIQDYNTVIKADPGFAEAYYQLGCVYHDRLNNLLEARVLFEALIKVTTVIIKSCPKYFEAWVLLAAAHYKLGRPDKAQEYLVYCDTLSNEISNLHKMTTMAEILSKYKFTALAEKQRQKIASLNEKKFDNDLSQRLAYLSVNVGTQQAELGDYQQAITTIKKPLQLNPKDVTAYNNLGYCYLELKQYAEAYQALTDALKLDPNNSYTKDRLGGLYLKLSAEQSERKQYDKAISYTKIALEFNPKDVTAYNNLGYCYLALKQYAEAFKAFNESLKLDTNNEYAKGKLIKLYFDLSIEQGERKQYDEAISNLKLLLELCPNHDTAYNHLGSNYLALQQYEKARDAFNECLKLNPSHKLAKENLSNCKRMHHLARFSIR